MAFAPESYARELETRPDTVTLAKAIHSAWVNLPDEHNTPDEEESDWNKLSQYMRWKFLVAADQATNAMQWGKIACDREPIRGAGEGGA